MARSGSSCRVSPLYGQVNTPAPLSVVKMTMVLSASPMTSKCFSERLLRC
jgi:hypothetical protein